MLAQLGIPFRVVPSTAREIHEPGGNAPSIAEINASAKARQVAQELPNSLVLGADTLVFTEKEVWGKPRDLADAEGMLLRLSGRIHRVVTAVCLMQREPSKQRTFAEITEVTFRNLSLTEIRAYLGSINPLDKAGAYAIQENGDAIVHSITGSYSNVVGLPMERLKTELAAWGRAT